MGCWWCLRLAAPTPRRPPPTSWSPWTPPATGCWPAPRPGSSRRDRLRPGHPQAVVCDESGSAEIVVDAATGQRSGAIELGGDDGNARLLVVDLDQMRVTAAYRVGRSPDVLAFDLGLGRLYVGSESGTVTVFAARAGRLVRLGAGVMTHAHAVAVDPRAHRVYPPLEREPGRCCASWHPPRGRGVRG